MAKLDNKVLFMTTSPRTAEKMIPEINLLNEYFCGQQWNKATQTEFMNLLREEEFFYGTGSNDPSFSARDRINRAPKALGFVVLQPTIQLTPAGKMLVSSDRTEDVFLRQLLKFQLPSPYHRETKHEFKIKPYLEIFRLIRHFGILHFEELQYFGLQLTNYNKFNAITKAIDKYRIEKSKNIGNVKKFQDEYFKKILLKIYAEEIKEGRTKTRESVDKSINNFLKTKRGNMRDYTDACIRYLRATGLVNISHIGRSLSIVPDRIKEVDYFLCNISRNPVFVDNEKRYVEYLGDVTKPTLMQIDYAQLKNQKEKKIAEEIVNIKNYKRYDEVSEMFEQIENNRNLYNAPLLLEWNTWRAMTMLDGGEIKANLKFDDFGMPMATAQGNSPDIECNYGDFNVIVEVTMASGQRQYETEGEPVSRHLAKIKINTGKPSYCLFIAPSINPACIAHFYALHRMNISYYGGESYILPLPLSIFRKMVEDSYRAGYTPNPKQVRAFFDWAVDLAKKSKSESEWYKMVQEKARDWLS